MVVTPTRRPPEKMLREARREGAIATEEVMEERREGRSEGVVSFVSSRAER